MKQKSESSMKEVFFFRMTQRTSSDTVIKIVNHKSFFFNIIMTLICKMKTNIDNHAN